MAVTTIPWGDGSGDNLYFTAPAMEGDQTVVVTSDANAGDERTRTVTFSADGVEPKMLGVIQLGSSGGREFDDWLKDGDTHLWINILNSDQLAQDIRIRMIGTIDWGDGSAKDSVSVTTYTTFSHTYAQAGRYRIDLHPTSGTFYLGGASSGTNVMGQMNSNTYYRTSVLYQVEIGGSLITTLSNYGLRHLYGLKKIYVPKSITTIGTQVFNNDIALASIEFEDWTKVTSFDGTSAFLNCQALQSLSGAKFDPGTAISQMIRNCNCLTEFTIHAGVTSIAANSFSNTYGLQRLYCLPASPPTVANANAFTGFNTGCIIYVPSGKLNAYKTANIWSTYANQMVEMTT